MSEGAREARQPSTPAPAGEPEAMEVEMTTPPTRPAPTAAESFWSPGCAAPCGAEVRLWAALIVQEEVSAAETTRWVAEVLEQKRRFDELGDSWSPPQSWAPSGWQRARLANLEATERGVSIAARLLEGEGEGRLPLAPEVGQVSSASSRGGRRAASARWAS